MYNPRPSFTVSGEGLRLTGGEARGRRLKGPQGPGLRPTSDRVRAALFSVLGARVARSRFLDVYAGTGAVGCEALSRAAERAVFVERDATALDLISKNLSLGAWPGAAEIVRGEALATLGRLAADGRRFDIVYLDPPYDDPGLHQALDLAARLLDPQGVVIVEHRSGTVVTAPPGLRRFRTYRHGDSALTVWRGSEDRRPE